VEKTVAERALAYLIVVLETRTAEQLDNDVVDLGAMLDAAGALDVYVLPEHAASRLIEARERLFWVSKAVGAKEIVDIVVPRSAVPSFLEGSPVLAHGTPRPSLVAVTSATATFISRCFCLMTTSARF